MRGPKQLLGPTEADPEFQTALAAYEQIWSAGRSMRTVRPEVYGGSLLFPVAYPGVGSRAGLWEEISPGMSSRRERHAFDVQIVAQPHSLAGVDPEPTSTPEFAEFRLDVEQLERLIGTLAEHWICGTNYLSSLSAIYSHPAAKLLVELGDVVVPYAINHLAEDPERWSWVLWRVTGAQPVDETTTRDDAPRVWRQWAQAHGRV